MPTVCVDAALHLHLIFIFTITFYTFVEHSHFCSTERTARLKLVGWNRACEAVYGVGVSSHPAEAAAAGALAWSNGQEVAALDLAALFGLTGQPAMASR